MDVWVQLNEMKKSELRELLGLEPVSFSLMIKKSWLRCFGHVER